MYYQAKSNVFIIESNYKLWMQIKRVAFYPELQKSQFQDVAETEKISIAAYHSYRKKGGNNHGCSCVL